MSKMTQETDSIRPKSPKIGGGGAQIPISTWFGLSRSTGTTTQPQFRKIMTSF